MANPIIEFQSQPIYASADTVNPLTAYRNNKIAMLKRLFNLSLRLGSLGAKLILTLYMGRYLGLTDIGTFGLVAAYVAIAIPLLGLRFDYVVTRDLIDTSNFDIAHKMRDQAVFYGLNYGLMAVVVLAVMVTAPVDLDAKLVVLTLILAILESFATITSSNLVSLGHPILSNALFFLRASLWVLPVILLGLFFPEYRTVETIFSCWLIGVLSSLVVNAYVWRKLPWEAVIKTPVNWQWVWQGLRKCFFIWVGAVGLASAVNIDRFFVEVFLGRDFVGIASFYSSFVVAIPSLLSSGIFAFTFPKLISLHRLGDRAAFQSESWRMTLQAMVAAAAVAIPVAIAVPILGTAFNRPEFTDHSGTLCLMLLGVWLRSSTESLYYVMYARHQDRDVWVGNLLLLVSACSCNAILVPMFGFSGIGYSAVISASLLCLWRIYRVKRFTVKGES